MQFPKWTPQPLIDLLNSNEELLRKNDIESPLLKCKSEIWERLATRTEMENIWKKFPIDSCPQMGIWAFGSVQYTIDAIDKIKADWHTALKASPKKYKEDLKEIENLSRKLQIKLEKFSSVNGENNPFLYKNLLNNVDRNLLSEFIRPEPEPDSILSSTWYQSHPENYLDHFLPNVSLIIKQISIAAKTEISENQYRFEIPRKIDADNAFRTYFIQKVGFYISRAHNKFSPSTIATFCSVALDDATLTPQVVKDVILNSDGLVRAPLTDSEILDLLTSIEICKNAVSETLKGFEN